MRIADPRTRADIIASLHQLVAFLHTHPQIPVPTLSRLDLTYFPEGDEEDRAAEVRRVADLLGTEPRLEGEHYVCQHRLGAAAYRVVAIPDRTRERHRALSTYTDNIRPD